MAPVCSNLNRRMPNGTYGGVRGGCSNNEQPPARLILLSFPYYDRAPILRQTDL